MDKKKILRIARKDLDATLKLERSLWKVKGIGKNFAHALRISLGFDTDKKLNELSDKEIEKLEDMVYHPGKYNIPDWLYNCRKDMEDGEDKHYVESNLILKNKNDISFLKKMRCYKGVRHQFGLPVRGQRTKGHFRKGATVGVIRKKGIPGKGDK
ncbi:MAG: 30S ribosomal protein S13 [Candidatus Aenigmarchaeota archaeon]|nr:30S ribosomal protein S13 [Candidatus Aenigmarchaeota archaeon]